MNRDIREALAQPLVKRAKGSRSSARVHHLDRGATETDLWDIAMDALLDKKSNEAATVVREILETHDGANMTPAFAETLSDIPRSVAHTFLVKLIAQNSKAARNLAKDIMIDQEVIQRDRVDAMHPLHAEDWGGDLYELSIDGDLLPYWIAVPRKDAPPRVGSMINFTVTEKGTPGMLRRTSYDGERYPRPMRQISIVPFLDQPSTEAETRKWLKEWWP